MFSAVTAGQEAAVEFFHEHVEEVKKHVPEDKLLVFEVKQGWKPLCDFLEVPVPDSVFPRINDTEAMQEAGRNILVASWFMIVIVPLGLFLLAYLSNTSLVKLMLGYGVFLLLLRIFGKKYSGCFLVHDCDCTSWIVSTCIPFKHQLGQIDVRLWSLPATAQNIWEEIFGQDDFGKIDETENRLNFHN